MTLEVANILATQVGRRRKEREAIGVTVSGGEYKQDRYMGGWLVDLLHSSSHL